MLERMRILHVSAPADVGGLESVIVTLAAGQARQGMQVMLALVSEDEEALPPWRATLPEEGVEIQPIVVPSRAYVMERKAVRRLVDTWEPTVVHTHGYRPDLVDAPVARRRGVPTVTTVHGFTGGGLKNRLYEWLQRRAFRRFGAVVAVSSRLAGELQDSGVPKAKIHVIPNAWSSPSEFLTRAEARAELGLAVEVPVVGWIGRLSLEKAPDLMIRAFACLEECPASLVMVGEGRLRGELQNLAKDLGVSERVFLPGVVPNAFRVLKAFDVLVLTSRTEGSPVVLLEAMAAGIPIVTRAVGGVPEMLSPQEAVLVDTPQVGAMVRALRFVLSGPEAAKSRAVRARHRFDKDFAVDPWVVRYREIYKGLLP